jgi:hypothetical protein
LLGAKLLLLLLLLLCLHQPQAAPQEERHTQHHPTSGLQAPLLGPAASQQHVWSAQGEMVRAVHLYCYTPVMEQTANSQCRHQLGI